MERQFPVSSWNIRLLKELEAFGQKELKAFGQKERLRCQRSHMKMGGQKKHV